MTSNAATDSSTTEPTVESGTKAVTLFSATDAIVGTDPIDTTKTTELNLSTQECPSALYPTPSRVIARSSIFCKDLADLDDILQNLRVPSVPRLKPYELERTRIVFGAFDRTRLSFAAPESNLLASESVIRLTENVMVLRAASPFYKMIDFLMAMIDPWLKSEVETERVADICLRYDTKQEGERRLWQAIAPFLENFFKAHGTPDKIVPALLLRDNVHVQNLRIVSDEQGKGLSMRCWILENAFPTDAMNLQFKVWGESVCTEFLQPLLEGKAMPSLFPLMAVDLTEDEKRWEAMQMKLERFNCSNMISDAAANFFHFNDLKPHGMTSVHVSLGMVELINCEKRHRSAVLYGSTQYRIDQFYRLQKASLTTLESLGPWVYPAIWMAIVGHTRVRHGSSLALFPWEPEIKIECDAGTWSPEQAGIENVRVSLKAKKHPSFCARVVNDQASLVDDGRPCILQVLTLSNRTLIRVETPCIGNGMPKSARLHVRDGHLHVWFVETAPRWMAPHWQSIGAGWKIAVVSGQTGVTHGIQELDAAHSLVTYEEDLRKLVIEVSVVF